jgi:hypothetical protein
MKKEPHPNSALILYQTEDGRTRIQCRFENETVWLTQQQMAELFQTTKQNVGQHLKSLFAEGELVQDSVVKDSFTTAADGKNYATNNLIAEEARAIVAESATVPTERRQNP